MTIGERIKKLRLEKEYTLDEIADKLNTSRQTIFKYENNIVTNIPSDKIEKLALIFNVSPAYIMGWEDVLEKNIEEFQPHTLDTLKKTIEKEPELTYKSLATVCMNKRIQLDWTEKKVASLANVDLNDYLNFENNYYKLPIRDIESILEALDLSISFVLGFICAFVSLESNRSDLFDF